VIGKRGAAARALARDELGDSGGALWAMDMGVGGLYMRHSKFRVDGCCRAAGFAKELSMGDREDISAKAQRGRSGR